MLNCLKQNVLRSVFSIQTHRSELLDFWILLSSRLSLHHYSSTPWDLLKKTEFTPRADSLLLRNLCSKKEPENPSTSHEGFEIDYLATVGGPNLSDSAQEDSSAVRRQEVSEEGFSMVYTSPIVKRKQRILEQIKTGKVKRGDREWAHRFPSDDEMKFEEIIEKPSEEIATYRVDQQSKFLDSKRQELPSWIGPVYLKDTNFVEHTDYISIEGGGKLGNKISVDEIEVDKLRVDTRISIKEKRYSQEGKLDELHRIEALDLELLGLHGMEYEVIMLLTVGVQGSGKSKFSMELVEHGSVPWARINQDTIRDGRRGTKSDCASKAEEMMKKGYCVVIDRMNFTRDQRDEFVNLAHEMKCGIHAIVFRLPFVENVYNVASRKQHEVACLMEAIQEIIMKDSAQFLSVNPMMITPLLFDNGCTMEEEFPRRFLQIKNIGCKDKSLGESKYTFLFEIRNMEMSLLMLCKDKTKLEETAELIRQDEILGRDLTMPIVVDPSVGSFEFPSSKQEIVGYLPSRDGPPVWSEDEGKEED